MKKLFASLSLTLILCACSQKFDEITTNTEQQSPYYITAVSGDDTKISATYDDQQGCINFTWSENDKLYVTVFEHGTKMTSELVKALPTYEFSLVSGAGTGKAVFSCSDFIPSIVFKEGKTYDMFAAYNPYKYGGSVWDTYYLPLVNTNLLVPGTMNYDPSNPLSNVQTYDMLAGRATGVAIDSQPVLNFIHGILIFKIKVRNTGDSQFSLKKLEFPTSAVYTSITSSLSGGGRYYGESHGCLLFNDGLTIASGDSVSLFIPAPQQTVSINFTTTGQYKFTFISNETVTFEKNLSVGKQFSRGNIYSTSFDINYQSNLDGSIPSISSNGNEF